MGARERLPGIAVPGDDRLSLIGDAHHVGLHAALRDSRRAPRSRGALENLVGVVLDPAGLRVVLGDLLVAATGVMRPSAAITRAVVPVVPWSIAKTCF